AVREDSGASRPLELVALRAGRPVPVELSATEIEAGGERLVLVVARDVSERNALADQLRQAQKVEATGQLAGGVAHDFNNVLAVVLMSAQFLLDEPPEGDPRRADMMEILAAAERGAALTRQLLAFTRRRPVEPRLVDLNDVVSDMARM